MSPRISLKNIFLLPGEYVVADEYCRISTLLGSCVAITLWHPLRKIGAMSHFILPTQNKKSSSTPNGRYGDEVLELMLQNLANMRVPAIECQAKVFGGGSMFQQRAPSDQPGVGEMNGRIARELLQAHRIPVVSESLFGVEHRKIIFEVATGEVSERRGNAADTATPYEKGLA
jgi:chemotaxis protein CheD